MAALNAFRIILIVACIAHLGWLIIRALRTGVIPSAGQAVQRSKNPVAYWFSIVVGCGAIALMLIYLSAPRLVPKRHLTEAAKSGDIARRSTESLSDSRGLRRAS
jgi:hypothetical protein